MFARLQIRRQKGAWKVAALATAAALSCGAETNMIPAGPIDWASVLPVRTAASVAKPRRILFFNLNVGCKGHPSIPLATEALARMGQRTGAYEAIVSSDPEIFRAERLAAFDAVCLNNSVGNLFTEPTLRKSLLEFITGGGGLICIHGAMAAFERLNVPGGAYYTEDWPEMGRIIGGRGAYHRSAMEKIVMRVEEPDHPLMAAYANMASAPLLGEFYRADAPYSRFRNRVLASIDIAASGLAHEPHDSCYRPGQDYGLIWVRRYGRGRVFTTALGHHSVDYLNPAFLKLLLAGLQFAAGDLAAPTVPSARLTPAIRAQERLGWKFGLEAYTFYKNDFFYTIDQAATMGLAYVGGLDFQRVSPAIRKNFTPDLTDAELEQIRLKLDDSGIRLLTYFYCGKLATDAERRKLFEFGKKMGVECFMCEPDLAALPQIDACAMAYHIKVGIHNHDQKQSPNNWSPDQILALGGCGRSPMIGACADVGFWMRMGIDPIEAVEKLRHRLVTLQMHDLDAAGRDVPWGQGVFPYERFLRKLRELNLHPVMFGLEYSDGFDDNRQEVKACADYFNALSLQMEKVVP